MQPDGLNAVPGTPFAAQAPEIPDHNLLRRIGRGSYGEVWIARNAIGTLRAVKIVHRQSFKRAEHFEREFKGLLKFEPVSRSHDGLVDILQIGRRDDEGYFFYIMELADDSSEECRVRSPELTPSTPNSALRIPHSYAPLTLRSEIQTRGSLPPAECVALILKLAAALEHMHANGLVHRDIKPSNIIFVNGQPKLADIGLVTGIDEAQSLVGTVGYIPPEGPGAPQADLYSLGQVLYEIAFGKDRQDFPQLPPDLQSHPDYAPLLELNEVILKACESDSRERYQSAHAMHADLVLLQRGQSVKERHVWQHRFRALRRIGITTAAAVLTLVGATFLWQMIDHRDAPVILTGNEDGTAATRNAEAAQAYSLGMRGLRRGTPEGFHQAVEKFTAAIKADPQFLAAHARLFETYLMSEDYDVNSIVGKEKYLENLSTNLMRLSPTNAESHAAWAIVLFLNKWRWNDAENEFKEALKANPNCRMALVYYGYFLTRQRRANEARTVLKRALEIDRDSPLITKFLGHCEYVDIPRRYGEALNFYLSASKLEPDYPGAHYWAGRAYQAMTNYEAALDEFEEHEVKQGSSPIRTRENYIDLHKSLQKEGGSGYWRKRLEIVNDLKDQDPYWYAECHARVGHKTEAMAGLRKAFLMRDTLEDLLVDEFWDDYRDDREFRNILRNVGLGKSAQ